MPRSPGGFEADILVGPSGNELGLGAFMREAGLPSFFLFRVFLGFF